MQVSVGTFNLNNLFSRFNFQAKVDAKPSKKEGGITLTFGTDDVAVRTFKGNLVKEKSAAATAKIARRITDEVDADVLAVQEVEHIEILRKFNRDQLGGLYPHVALIEGNDARLIDVGILSKLPIGRITSHQTAVHPDDPNRRVFGRDLLEVEILDPQGKRKLFTVYNTHMKSHFVPRTEDQAEGKKKADARRKRQAETISKIISANERQGGKFILLGDMNDPPKSEFLEPMLMVDGRPLTNALAGAIETRPPKPESPNQGPGPQSPVWTHRYDPPGPGTFPEYELYDHVWLSEGLAPALRSAHIDRRKNHGGDGSDHDPAWVVLDV